MNRPIPEVKRVDAQYHPKSFPLGRIPIIKRTTEGSRRDSSSFQGRIQNDSSGSPEGSPSDGGTGVPPDFLLLPQDWGIQGVDNRYIGKQYFNPYLKRTFN
jgi:hypothetical protein